VPPLDETDEHDDTQGNQNRSALDGLPLH